MKKLERIVDGLLCLAAVAEILAGAWWAAETVVRDAEEPALPVETAAPRLEGNP